jgi:hypothetical protein
MSSQLPWFVARATGLMAWALATAAIVWGLTLSTKLVRRKGIPAWLLGLHTYLGTLSLVFVAVHLGALWVDRYVHFGPAQLLVPLASTWRPGPVAWGIVSMYLLVAVQLTSWLRRYLPRRLWHGVHLTSFAVFVGATVHAWTAGTDRNEMVLQWIALSATTLVVFLVVFRLTAPRRRAVVPAELRRELARRSPAS